MEETAELLLLHSSDCIRIYFGHFTIGLWRFFLYARHWICKCSGGGSCGFFFSFCYFKLYCLLLLSWKIFLNVVYLRGKRTRREVFSLLVHSPKARNSHGELRVKAGSQELDPGLPHRWCRSSDLSQYGCLSESALKLESGEAPMCDTATPSHVFTAARTPVPLLLFQRHMGWILPGSFHVA